MILCNKEDRHSSFVEVHKGVVVTSTFKLCFNSFNFYSKSTPTIKFMFKLINPFDKIYILELYKTLIVILTNLPSI
jgi:hypothetical protein